MGVKSTVIDPRERVGMLPGRDRKVWKRALRKQEQHQQAKKQQQEMLLWNDKSLVCQPIVPFGTQRSWFGAAPTEFADASFRHSDRQTLSVCDEESALVQQASAIVALHPDEATDEVVRVALARKVPFLVVPCCVFARLFPMRRIRPSQQSVGTYPDLVRYLQEQDPSIRVHKFSFAGRNTALWSIF